MKMKGWREEERRGYKKVQDLGFDTQYHTHTDFNRMPASGQLVMLNVTFLL